MNFIKICILLSISFLSWQFTWAQEKLNQEKSVKNKNPYPNTYVSEIDQFLSLKSVVVAPSYDNVGGVYQKAAEAKLSELISKDYFWTAVEFKSPDSHQKFRMDWLEDKPEYTKEIIKLSKADALLSVITTKSSSGLSTTLNLFIKDGSLFLSTSYQDEKTFEIKQFNEIVERLYNKIKQKLPYNGTIASRTGQNVTVNLGEKSGLKKGDRLTVAQILALKRHPKLKFMTGVEKEVIGQILITQVDSDLSFGRITFEKEIGVIQKNSKLLPLNYVDYESEENLNSQKNLEKNEDSKLWNSAEAPQYGKVGVSAGLSDFKLSSVQLATGKNYSTASRLGYNLKLAGELWITSEWFAGMDYQQHFVKTDSGLSGSSPSDVTINNSQYGIIFGYKYSITGVFWGPQLEVGFGYIGDSTHVTDTAPTAFTTTETKGLQIRLGGHFPLTDDYKTSVGGKFHIVLFESQSESPVNSGSNEPSMNKMSLYLTHALNQNFQIKPEIEYQIINTNYKGNSGNLFSVRSTEERSTSYGFGIEYLF